MKITMIATAASLLLLFAASIGSQELKATGLEQCRADVASWTHDFSYVQNANAEALLTSSQLMDRSNELRRCSMMEDKEPYRSAIGSLGVHYYSLLIERMHDFLARHDMMDDFQKEDANGLR